MVQECIMQPTIMLMDSSSNGTASKHTTSPHTATLRVHPIADTR